MQCYVSGCYIKFSLNKACPYSSWENGHVLPAEKNMTQRTWGGGRLRRQTTKKVLVFEGEANLLMSTGTGLQTQPMSSNLSTRKNENEIVNCRTKS